MYKTLKEELYDVIYCKLNTPAVFEIQQGYGVFTAFPRSSLDRLSSGKSTEGEEDLLGLWRKRLKQVRIN